MIKKPQMSMANALTAMTLSAIWCALYASRREFAAYVGFGHDGVMYLFLGVLTTLPAGVVGAILGRPWVGLICGAAAALADYAVLVTTIG